MSWVIIYLDRMLPYDSSNLPVTRRAAVSSRLGLASDGVYRACPVTSTAVSSYLAISPLPVEYRRYLSVALSRESPPPDVIRHPAL